jgi:hypothetical protein
MEDDKTKFKVRVKRQYLALGFSISPKKNSKIDDGESFSLLSAMLNLWLGPLYTHIRLCLESLWSSESYQKTAETPPKVWPRREASGPISVIHLLCNLVQTALLFCFLK